MKAGFVLPLLLLGGADSTSLVIAQSQGTFAATGSMSTGRVFHTSTLLNDGRVLVAGGYVVCGSGLGSAELYNPSTGTFTSTGNMTTPRYRHTATLLTDGKVLVAGGSVGSSCSAGDPVLASAEIYDPSTGTFSPTADMTTPRTGHSATLLRSGAVLIAGGHGTRAELYDPSTGRFTPTGDMTAARTCPKANLLANGKVLITSGAGCGLSEAFNHLSELYDPETGTFSATGGSTPSGVSGDAASSASLLTNGKVLVTSEISNCDYDVKEAALYAPSTGLFSPTGDMVTARCLGRGTGLSDGAVLITGAYSCTNASEAEVYDPASGTFARTGDMTAGRFLHTMTLLKDGRVLIVGGVGVATMPCGAWAPAGAELYTPASVVPAPALLSLSSNGQGAILHAGTPQVVSGANPAVAGEALEIYSSGLLNGSVIPPQVAIGGRMAEVLFFGDAPGFAGLNQVNVRVPNGVAPGPAVPVRLTYLGRPSNEVTIGIR